MIRPDYRNFSGCLNLGGILVHSAKGSTWKEHKYIRKDSNGRYYYSNDGGKGEDAESKARSRIKEFEKTSNNNQLTVLDDYNNTKDRSKRYDENAMDRAITRGFLSQMEGDAVRQYARDKEIVNRLESQRLRAEEASRRITARSKAREKQNNRSRGY